MITDPNTETESVPASRAPAWDAPVRYMLAALWLILPCIQYLGAVARTAPLPQGQPISPLAAIDLTPWYVLLVGASVLYCLLRWLLRREYEA